MLADRNRMSFTELQWLTPPSKVISTIATVVYLFTMSLPRSLSTPGDNHFQMIIVINQIYWRSVKAKAFCRGWIGASVPIVPRADALGYSLCQLCDMLISQWPILFPLSITYFCFYVIVGAMITGYNGMTAFKNFGNLWWAVGRLRNEKEAKANMLWLKLYTLT